MFYAEFAEAVLNWCDLAEREIRGWPDVAGAGLTEATRQHLENVLRRYERRRSVRDNRHG